MRVKHDSSACESVFTGNRVVPRIMTPSLFMWDGVFFDAVINKQKGDTKPWI